MQFLKIIKKIIHKVICILCPFTGSKLALLLWVENQKPPKKEKSSRADWEVSGNAHFLFYQKMKKNYSNTREAKSPLPSYKTDPSCTKVAKISHTPSQKWHGFTLLVTKILHLTFTSYILLYYTKLSLPPIQHNFIFQTPSDKILRLHLQNY